MDKEELKKKYKSKIAEYTKHNKLYYQNSSPAINDSDFDNLKAQIIDLEKKYDFLKSKKSPSKNVGYKSSKLFEKYEHKVPMLSLSNAFYEDDLLNFEKKFLIF